MLEGVVYVLVVDLTFLGTLKRLGGLSRSELVSHGEVGASATNLAVDGGLPCCC